MRENINQIQVNPEFIINELLEQIKKLQLDNVILKGYINEITNKSKEISNGDIAI